MRKYALVAFGVYAALAAFAIWMGGLNQDEGWYLYAAEQVSSGRAPYRDFFYTQGPLMPAVYSFLSFSWHWAGLLGARIATSAIGLAGILVFSSVAARLVPKENSRAAFVAAFALLGCNLYHVYFVSIPKSYALAALFAASGFSFACDAAFSSRRRLKADGYILAGLSFALSAGVRASMAAIPVACAAVLFAKRRREGAGWAWLLLGCITAAAAVYGPVLCDPAALHGFVEAQKYHAARSGRSILLAAGSLSRILRWYAPLFLAGAAAFALRPRKGAAPGGADADGPASGAGEAPARSLVLCMLLTSFACVFALHMCAAVPYDDYQTPVAGLAAAAVPAILFSASGASSRIGSKALLAAIFAVSFVCASGSPLLEKWTVNGQDRLWTLKKDKSELAQLRDVARRIEKLDPGGKTLFTQDLYLAIETGRSVPAGLEMGPFSMLGRDELRHLVATTDCPVAALSGYAFAIDPPSCDERPMDEQWELWKLAARRYSRAFVEEMFGQNATTLVVMKLRSASAPEAKGVGR